MQRKQLTQTGLNRAMWIMLRKLGGRVVIREHDLENPNIEDAMEIQHDPAAKVFVFSLHKVKDNKNISRIIIPSRN